jgi:cell division protein FtsB
MWAAAFPTANSGRLTAESGEATLPAMSRAHDRDTTPEDEAIAQDGGSAAVRGEAVSVGLADLPVAGLTRRRIALLLGALVAAWVILLFAHQVGEASAAAAKVAAMRTSNAALAANVAALKAEVELIQRQSFVEQQARAYRLGTAREIPFTLSDNAPSLPPDAPGSAGVRLGASVDQPTPIEQWVRLLFGPGDDPSNPTASSRS